jgi:hypothetical protein
MPTAKSTSKPVRKPRLYYSARSGLRPAREGFSLVDLKRLFLNLFGDFAADGFFQEWFGHSCVDGNDVLGKGGTDIDLFIFRKLRRMEMWPLHSRIDGYSEADLFDVMELLFDHCSEGKEGWHHNFADCGWHYETFDKASGQARYRDKLNELLVDYGRGFQLTEEGEIVALPSPGLEPLLEATLPTTDPANIELRVAAAVHKFRRRESSGEERRDAVRDLADVLEYLRDKTKAVLATEDERDLFNIANNFGIRHHRRSQKIGYDQAVWHSWMFYVYLATIHACLRLLNQAEAASSDQST